MKHRPYLLLSLLLLMGVSLHTQTLEEFSKRLAIEGGISFSILDFQPSIKNSMAEAGYPDEFFSELNRVGGYFGISFRLNDYFIIGYKNVTLNSRDYTGICKVKQECRRYFFGNPICKNELAFDLSIRSVNTNQFYVRWNLEDKSFGLSAGLFLYNPKALYYGYITDVFAAFPREDQLGYIEAAPGVGFSLGSDYHYTKLHNSLILKAGLYYYWFPKTKFGPIMTELGTFPESEKNMDRFNLEVGVGILLF